MHTLILKCAPTLYSEEPTKIKPDRTLQQFNLTIENNM